MIKTILIVDDDGLAGRGLYRVVERFVRGGSEDPGTDVGVHFVHGDGRDAVKLLDEQPRLAEGEILLLTDGNMPGMDGVALIEELQKRLGDRLAAVMTTGNAAEFVPHADRLGFVLVEKPVDSEVVRGFVRTFLLRPKPAL